MNPRLRRVLVIAVPVFLAVFLVGVFVTYCVLPVLYRATSVITVRPLPDVGTVTATRTVLNHEDFLAAARTIRSDDVLGNVVSEMNLNTVWAARHFHGITSSSSTGQDIEVLNSILRIHHERGTNRIDLSIVSDVPAEAANITDSIVDHFREVQDDIETNRIMAGGGSASPTSEIDAIVASKKPDDLESPVDMMTNAKQQDPLYVTISNKFGAPSKPFGHSRSSPVRLVHVADMPKAPITLDKRIDLFIAVIASIYCAALVTFITEALLWWYRSRLF